MTKAYKTYIGIARDRSGSIRSYGLERPCARDYNSQLQEIQHNTQQHQLDSIISVVDFGSSIEPFVTVLPVMSVQPQSEHLFKATLGQTRLYDAVGYLINQFSRMPDANDPNVSFLILAITDGEENASYEWLGSRLGGEIFKLHATDRWTFTFRVPHGYKRSLVNMGIPANNIMEWEQTEQGLRVAETATRAATASYFSARATGVGSTKAFYTTDLSGVDVKAIQSTMTDISAQVNEWKVTASHCFEIRDFCERMTGKPMLRGAAFYELVKKEDEVQEYKLIMIRDRATRAVYAGHGARQLLGLPTTGTIQLRPGDHAAYDVFIQSTSVNRKLPVGTTLMYWPNVGVGYIDGKSSAKAAPVHAKITKVRKAGDPAQLIRKKQIAAGFTQPTALANSVDYNVGYKIGYKDGRGKKKNLANAGQYSGNVAGYSHGFADGKAKKPMAVK